MFSIDFATLPDISKKLDQNEINNLNALFRESAVQEKIEEIEVHRKKRQKWKWGIICWSVLLSWGLALILWKGNIINGALYYIGSGGDLFSPVLWTFIVIYGGGMTLLYTAFSSKIETPLKKDILSRICPMLYSKLQYSHDARFSFMEIDILRHRWLLKPYTDLDIVEDSIFFDVAKDNKNFTVHGFELQTSEETGTGKRRRKVVTNHCYLMRVHFPHARIPLQDDILIQQDTLDTLSKTNLFAPTISALVIAIITAIALESILLGIVIGVCIWVGVFMVPRIWSKKHRVELENVEFEKIFDVKCRDTITSRMIITPAFMDRIVQLTKKTGNRYEFLLQENIMYIKRVITWTYLDMDTHNNITKNLWWFVQFYIDMREIMLFISEMNLMYLSQTAPSTTESKDEILKAMPLSFKSWIQTNRLNRFLTNMFLSNISSDTERRLW